MLISDPYRIHANFDRWATLRLLAVCRGLGEPALDRQFAIGLGSLRRTFTHLVSNMEHWFDRADASPARPMRPFNSKPGEAMDSISQRFDAAWADVKGIIERHGPAGLAQVISSEFAQDDGSKIPVRFTRGSILLHVFNHGTHHRVQCLNMLRHLGVDPLPEIDLIDSNQEVGTAP